MLLGASIYAATYYVDRDNPNASDAANVGTEAVPFVSIQAAVDKAAAGDVVKVKLYSISKDYLYFLVGQKLAIGVNPAMGAFPAITTNIFSNCYAIGWFATTSVIEGEGVYHESVFDVE